MTHDSTYRRVVVALDSSRDSRAALDASAGLAANLGVELAGLFIEDVNQLRWAALPFTRLVGPDAMSRDIDMDTVERSMRRAASEARSALARLTAARGDQVRWSFRVVRGAVARELGAAAEPTDLIVVEERALGRTARTALASAQVSVLCLCAGSAGSNEVVVVYGESEQDERALHAAIRIARATDRTLTVLVTDADQEASLLEAIDTEGVAVQQVRISDRARDFAQAVAQRPGAVVVWHGPDDEPDTQHALEPLLESGRYSVLVAR